MRNHLLLVAALCAASPLLLAQDPPKAAAPAAKPPDPKTPEHDALKAFVGDWACTMKCDEDPEAKGTEHSELICNGLFLKATFTGTFKGTPFDGVWIAGYDKNEKAYTGLWADAMDPSIATWRGSFDPKTKTWTWKGKCSQGSTDSTVVHESADSIVETCTTTTPEGKKLQAKLTRKRLKAPPPPTAAPVVSKELPKETSLLHKDIGEWDASVTCTMPGMPATTDKGTERVTPILGGKWMWGDFNGQFMGTPFEGHALYGYDTQQKQYVSHWLDSCAGVVATATGTYDEKTKALTFNGKGIDENGKPMTFTQTLTSKDAATRHMRMECKGAQPSSMEIAYKRVTKG